MRLILFSLNIVFILYFPSFLACPTFASLISGDMVEEPWALALHPGSSPKLPYARHWMQNYGQVT